MAYPGVFRRIAHRARAIPGRFGLRTYRTYTVHRKRTGVHTGDGAIDETVVEITEHDGQPPKVRWLNGEERSIQQIDTAAVEIGPITPDHTGGGTALAEIKLATDRGDERYIRLVGPEHPNGADYRITDIKSHKALHWMITAQPVASR